MKAINLKHEEQQQETANLLSSSSSQAGSQPIVAIFNYLLCLLINRK
jgi:hypothetical protein